MGKTDKRTMTAKQRRAEAVELRMAGYTYKRIAEHLGISEGAAFKTVKVALDEVTKQTKDNSRTLIELELQRLDRIHQALWPRALQGDLKAIDRIYKAMERRAKLIGLDAPTKQANTNIAGDKEVEAMQGVVVVPAVADSVDEWLAQFNPQK